MTYFSEAVQLFLRLEKTNSRIDKVRYLVDFISRLDRDEYEPFIRILSGKIFPPYSGKTLDVGGALIFSVLKKIRERRGSQVTLVEFKPTIKNIYSFFEKIALARGENSRKKKARILENLFLNLNDIEIEYLLRSIFGEMRIGVSEGIILEAFSKLVEIDIDKVRRAYMFIGDIGDLARIVAYEGGEGVINAHITLFRPVKPMLAEMSYSLREVLREFKGMAGLEFKYDGIRIQVHKYTDDIRIFSRRLTDITSSFPELIKMFRKKIFARQVILDGEVIGIVDGKPVRFQDLAKRVRRRYDVEKMIYKIPLKPYFFDILYLDGEMLVEKSYIERWSILNKIVDKELLAERTIVKNIQAAEIFLKKAESLGHEGIMAKRLDSDYTPGIRGKKWFKIKPADTLDLVIVGAEWGHGRRRGWLSDYYLAVYDDENDEFLVVGKTFKGLTDDEFREMTKRLLELKVEDHGYMVKVKPEIVVEVAYNEIQQSSRYRSGYALRFARIIRIRFDRNPHDITTLKELKKRYKMQFKYKSHIAE